MWPHFVFLAAVLLLLQTQLAAAANQTNTTNDVLLTSQLGPYPVTINSYEVKTNRTDPLAPTHQLRNLVVTVYRPASKNLTCPTQDQDRIPYARPEVLKALLGLLPSSGNSSSAANEDTALLPALERVQIANCTASDLSASSKNPILLFGPGLRATHDVYTTITMASASFGYTVIAIDHTYESAAVVFPDGSVNYTSPTTFKLIQEGHKGIATIQDIRTADVASVLDAMEKGQIPGLERGTNEKQIAMYGHSLGGSTATNAALMDNRIKASINLDGTFFGAPNETIVHKPLLMVGYPTDWPNFYANHDDGWKTWVQINNTEHYSYTDLPLIADLLNLRGKAIPLSLTGTINSQRLQAIISSYTNHFFDFFLRGEKTNFFQGPRANYPDVQFIAHSQPKD
ncbi:uncharacterized protein FA14DRAFT_154194 [Meira miltonrushii]|uniref:1-alkyl-2-acetylglycerophosphocholine esterase n=1 Tax=Meira miltonrushii TaxID=1280837 RepID=A0A316VCA4_9BASI|nr:uncharacterized protein FA14DRAFT_154194 [Meira miltonrushii]PWN34748.1 hypothetical protein FA14DRAFT_154194 [Meira miltonrushii]